MNVKDKLTNLNIEEKIATIKETLGLQPQEVENNLFIPAKSALLMAAPSKSDYEAISYDSAYDGNKKILMVCTEQGQMTMKNGKVFSTGNQPIETLVPLLHFKQAGFKVDVFTPTGQPVQLEMWAMPEKDDKVKAIYKDYQPQFEQPKSLAEFAEKDMSDNDDYIAIFIPGGHGAMLGLPDDRNLGTLLRWGHENDLFTLSICHGPAALLSANTTDPDSGEVNPSNEGFIFEGYEIVAFTDILDKQMPKLGYLPGEMTWYFNEKLEGLGVTITNRLATGNTLKDRRLITGDGPLAANDFGKLCVQSLLKVVGNAQ